MTKETDEPAAGEPQLMLDTGGHMALIKDIAFTPDGRQLVSASDDKTIRVWDLETGKTVRTIRGEIAPGHPGTIYAMALSPDGKWLAAGGMLAPFDGSNHIEVGSIRLYEFTSGELVARLLGHENVVNGLAFSPDGRQLISGQGGQNAFAIIWDVETRQLKHLLRGHSAQIYAVGFTPDGQRAVTGSDDNDLRLWRVEDGGEIARMTGHGDKVRSLAVAPDGSIASGDWSGEIRLWDGKTGVLLKVLAQQGTYVGGLSFSPDGKTQLSGTGGTVNHNVYAYDVASGREIVTYRGHDNIVLASAISPDGRWAATGGGNKREIHIWDLHTGERRPGPDGQLLTLGGQGQSVWAVGFSADGRRIGWGNRWTQHDPKNGYGPLQHALTLPSAEDALPRPFSLTEAIPPHPDADASALSRQGRGQERDGSASGASHINREGRWQEEERATSQPSPLAGEGGEGRSPLPGEGEQTPDEGGHSPAIEWSRATASHGGWSLEHRKGGAYGHDAILDIKQDGLVVQSIERGPTDGYNHRSYSFTTDGETIISGGANGVLTAYDSAGSRLGDFTGHEDDVWAVAPSPDGRFLVSGADDQTVRLWNLKTRELLITLFHGTDGEWVMWTPEGYYVSSPDGDQYIGWQINRGADKAADYVRASQLSGKLFRPDIVARTIELASATAALAELGAPANILDLLHVNRPPEFRILLPENGAKVQDSPGSIVVEAEPNPEPLSPYEIIVNGRQVATRDFHALRDFGARPARETLPVPLEQGRNDIRIIARNRIGTAERDLRLHFLGRSQLDQRGTLYVVAIGVDEYTNAQHKALRYAGADARAFCETMLRYVAPLHERAECLLLARDGDQEPTSANIQDAMLLFRKAEPQDTVVLFLAGHGVIEGQNDYVFLPQDIAGAEGKYFKPSTAVRWSVFQEALQNALGRRLLFVDTCHSGSAYNPRLVKDAHNASIIVFSATDSETKALEMERLGHGVFTYALMQGLAGAADPRRDGEVELFALQSYVSRAVRSLTNRRQSPAIHLSGVTDFVIARK